MKKSVLTRGLLIALTSASLFGPACQADRKRDLPDAPVLAEASCHATHAALACPEGPQQGSAPPQGAATLPAVESRDGSKHRFWDRQNLVLFSLVGAARALDYSSTLNMRRRGRQEILLTNDIVDNRPAFAAIEAGGIAVSMGASYLFHRYKHHRLERWTSIIHASLTTTGAVRNYCLKTARPSTTP